MKTVSNLILFAIFAVVVEEVTSKYVLVEINDGEEKVDDQKVPLLKAQSRAFKGPVKVEHQRIRYPDCKHERLQRKDKTAYFIKRYPQGNNKGDLYTYFAVVEETDGHDQRLSEVVGRKRGSCRISVTPDDPNCGFQMELLKVCFQDRALKNDRLINRQKGFNPTDWTPRGGEEPFWYKDKIFAWKAHNACNRMVHFEIPSPIDFGTPESVINAMMDIAYAVAAAQEAHVETNFLKPVYPVGLNLVFSNRKMNDAGVDTPKLFKKRVIELARLFPTNQATLNLLNGDNMNNFLRRINDLYFCQIGSDDPKVPELLAGSDPQTETWFNAAVDQLPPIPNI